MESRCSHQVSISQPSGEGIFCSVCSDVHHIATSLICMRPTLYATARNVELREVSPLSSRFDDKVLAQVHLLVEIHCIIIYNSSGTLQKLKVWGVKI